MGYGNGMRENQTIPRAWSCSDACERLCFTTIKEVIQLKNIIIWRTLAKMFRGELCFLH